MTAMLGEGFLVSLQIFAFTLLGSLPLGMLVAFARMSRFKPLALLARLYISIMRGTPLMLQMFAIYFVPYYVFGIRLTTDSKWYATIVAFIINYAAYFAEIYRSGIQSIPRGQHEAAQVLGYSKTQTFVRIVLPQVVKRIMPSMTNEVITRVKDTSPIKTSKSSASVKRNAIMAKVLPDKPTCPKPLPNVMVCSTHSPTLGDEEADLMLDDTAVVSAPSAESAHAIPLLPERTL